MAKWSRSFMIFPVLLGAGESVVESVKALLQPADDNAVESFGAYSPAAGDGKKETTWGSIPWRRRWRAPGPCWDGAASKTFGAVPKNSYFLADFGQPLQVPGQDQTRAQGEARRAPKHPSRDRGDGKGGLGSDDEDAPAGSASGRDVRVSENEKNSRRSARSGRELERGCTAGADR